MKFPKSSRIHICEAEHSGKQADDFVYKIGSYNTITVAAGRTNGKVIAMDIF